MRTTKIDPSLPLDNNINLANCCMVVMAASAPAYRILVAETMIKHFDESDNQALFYNEIKNSYNALSSDDREEFWDMFDVFFKHALIDVDPLINEVFECDEMITFIDRHISTMMFINTTSRHEVMILINNYYDKSNDKQPIANHIRNTYNAYNAMKRKELWSDFEFFFNHIK